MISKGIKPIYVFDGKPPTFKSGEVIILNILSKFQFYVVIPSLQNVQNEKKKHLRHYQKQEKKVIKKKLQRQRNVQKQ